MINHKLCKEMKSTGFVKMVDLSDCVLSVPLKTRKLCQQYLLIERECLVIYL
jgi:hypothetical protein